MSNRVWRLRTRPQGALKDTDLELVTEPLPSPGPGQLLMRNVYLSIDPTHRIWMSDKAGYMPSVPLGDVMRCMTIAVVEQSNDPTAHPVGQHFLCFGGVCEHFIGIPGENVLYPTMPPAMGLPLTADLSVCSAIIGLTAWHGVNKILCPTSDSVVCVSGAAGAVGSLVGQLCKLKGAKVIGIAGGKEKCQHMQQELGFDAAVDYKAGDVSKALAAIAPEGITHYFDNVGGQVSDAVLEHMRIFSKYALCGSISEYDDAWAGQKNFNMILMRRISVQGFICTDHMADELDTAKAELAELAAAGKVKYTEDVREGLENYPATVRLLMSGANTGKLLLKL